MKAKIAEWGNSHGIRITSPMLDHLNVGAGGEVQVNFTQRGIEIVKNDKSVDYLSAVAKEVLDAVLESTQPVSIVNDPYAEGSTDYQVFAINPCQPLIREVPKGTAGAYTTLVEAKEAARQVLQSALAEAKQSLCDLRQLGIGNIRYIAL